MEHETTGDEIDQFTEKRQFPILFLQKFLIISFTYIPTDYNHKKWNILKKIFAKKLNSPPNSSGDNVGSRRGP
jgi:hypothetical protein